MSDSKKAHNPKVNEFKSMKTCIATLDKLPKPQRDRVIKYLQDYFDDENVAPLDLSDLENDAD